MQRKKQPSFLVVGQGLAGTIIGLTLHEAGCFVKWVDQPNLSNASHVASGLYNPVVLKRMRLVHLAESMMHTLQRSYPRWENKLKASFYHSSIIHRVLHNAGERNNWEVLRDQEKWKPWLGEVSEAPSFFHAPFGLGEVLHTGYVDTTTFLHRARAWMDTNHGCIEATVNAAQLVDDHGTIRFQGLEYDHVVFAEGWRAALENPWYPADVFRPSKGEVLEIQLPLDKRPSSITHFEHFIIPLKNGNFRLGATYVHHGTMDEIPGKEGMNELVKSVDKIIPGCNVRVVDAKAGIRAATKDRRPLIGQHPKIPSICFFNGMGSRAVLMAPFLAQTLVNNVLHQVAIPAEVDIRRYF